MPTNHSGPTNRIMILLAPGFEETAVVYCLEHMREAGLPISLVGLSAGILKGSHGLAVRPDYSLDQLSPESGHRGVIVPGGPACVSALLTDPRVHQLFNMTMQYGGFVAVLATAVPLFARSFSVTAAASLCFMQQGEMKISEFTDYLIDIVLA